MFRSIAFRLAAPILMAVTALPLPVFAQSPDTQSPSVAEAARRAREQKKKSEKTEKPGKVITEDTLKPASGDPQTAALPGQPKSDSAEESGNPSAPGATGSQGAAKASAAPAEKPDGEKAKAKAEEAALKQQLAQAEKSLDLLKRELALDQDTYYSNADYVHDTPGKAKLDSLKQQIASKQQDIERLKTRLAAVRELLRLPAKDSSAPPQP